MSVALAVLALLIAVSLACVHVFSPRLKFLNATPRSRWLSAAGGVSVAYVFVHLLPDLASEQRDIREAVGESFGFLEYHVYLVALFGLVAFYGLERLVGVSRRNTPGAGSPAGVFYLHVASFGVYNALIGYLLLHREEPGLNNLLLYGFAMGLHFAVNDSGLRRSHGRLYDRYGRWILVAAVAVGFALGAVTEIGEASLAVLFALLGGGVILNVLKEEVPEERESSFRAFFAGAALYAVVLILAS